MKILLEYLIANLGTILVLLVVLAIITSIILVKVRNRRLGKTGCSSCSCKCPNRGNCQL